MEKGKPAPAQPAQKVAKSTDGKTSANEIRPEYMGYLSVQIFFHKVPMSGLKVRFLFPQTLGKGQQALLGSQPIAEVETDEKGVAAVPSKVAIGNYICRIEYQTRDALVTTVAERTQTVPIVLPVGRPYFNLDQDVEFGP